LGFDTRKTQEELKIAHAPMKECSHSERQNSQTDSMGALIYVYAATVKSGKFALVCGTLCFRDL
jgi:hypothetical protein